MKLNLEIQLEGDVLDYYRKLFEAENANAEPADFETYVAHMASLLLESLYESSVVR